MISLLVCLSSYGIGLHGMEGGTMVIQPEGKPRIRRFDPVADLARRQKATADRVIREKETADRVIREKEKATRERDEYLAHQTDEQKDNLKGAIAHLRVHHPDFTSYGESKQYDVMGKFLDDKEMRQAMQARRNKDKALDKYLKARHQYFNEYEPDSQQEVVRGYDESNSLKQQQQSLRSDISSKFGISNDDDLEGNLINDINDKATAYVNFDEQAKDASTDESRVLLEKQRDDVDQEYNERVAAYEALSSNQGKLDDLNTQDENVSKKETKILGLVRKEVFTPAYEKMMHDPKIDKNELLKKIKFDIRKRFGQ